MNNLYLFFLRLLLAINNYSRRGIEEIIGKIKKGVASDKKLKKAFKKRFLNNIDPHEVSMSALVYLKKQDLPIRLSFGELMKMNRLQVRESEKIEWRLNDKITGAKFAEEYGLKIPHIYQEGVGLKNINLTDNIIIKPRSGASSRGVFIYLNKENIYELKSQKKIRGVDDFLSKANSLIKNNIIKDEWIVEQYIINKSGNIAHDLKFYTFYGKVAAIVEVERMPTLKYCYWDREQKVLHNSPNKSYFFKGSGFNPEYIPIVERLSLEIPVPFMRIDFLDSETNLIFGEFTPSPGSSSQYSGDLDAMLGREYVEAESRLFNDLLNGKPFEFAKNVLERNGK